jgi:hypothetical protein
MGSIHRAGQKTNLVELRRPESLCAVRAIDQRNENLTRYLSVSPAPVVLLTSNRWNPRIDVVLL